jgi:hypothetical protein
MSTTFRVIIAICFLEALLILQAIGFSYIDSVDRNWLSAQVIGVMCLFVLKALLLGKTRVSVFIGIAALLFSILTVWALEVVDRMDGRERVGSLTRGFDIYRLSHVDRSGAFTVTRCKVLVFSCEWVVSYWRDPKDRATMLLYFDENRNEVQLLSGERIIAILWPTRQCVGKDRCKASP